MVDRDITLQRRDVVARILRDRGETLVVTGLGSATWDVAAAGDDPRNFYLWGGMGGAAVMGLGLALAQPERRVLVITGDGEMLMALGSLATIAVAAPANLAICILDNERYGETGMQETHTAHAVDIVGMAAAAGFSATATVVGEAELEIQVPVLLETPGPVFVTVKVTADPVPLVLPPRDGTWLKHRFRGALLGDAAYE
jgi:thiamine pyrophosphate-dependent acetolactate synthase large subunit-like protein